MSDKTKLKLIVQLIDNYYELFSSSDNASNAAHMASTLDAIFTIAWLNEDEEEGNKCSCSGECHNCVE